MGKKQKRLTEKVAEGKQTKEKKSNPFEFKFNKQKHQVIGRKLTKAIVGGVPGSSRKRANDQRKETLLNEYKRFGKVNRVVDKRVGQNDSTLSVEEKSAKRFALEREKRYKKKKNVYHLDDNETLTHYGQSLTDIERHDIPQEEEETAMTADFVSRAHFGGGLKDQEDAFAEAQDGNKSRKTIIQELIARSKLEKHEKQIENDERMDLTDKLDDDWKDIVKGNVLNNFTPTTGEKKDEIDDYDKLVRTLQFERSRGKATDRLKTPAEIAKEERDRLERLEKERLKRMNEPSSVDDLNDNVELDFVVQYKDGKLIDSEKLESKDKEDENEQSDSNSSDSEDENEDISTNVDRPPVAKTAEIPFVINMPNSYEKLTQLLSEKTSESQAIVLDRLIKCHHPSLKNGNKQRLQKLFLMLLRYFDSISSRGIENSLIDYLTAILYQLSQFSPTHAAKCCRSLLKQHVKVYRKRKRHWLRWNCLAFLRLIPHLFPASDATHPVVTPCLLFMSSMISKVHNRNEQECAHGLVLCSIFIQYVTQSKRYVPELVAYLLGILYVAVDHSNTERSPTGTFPLCEPHSKMLLVTEKNSTDLLPSLFAIPKDIESVTLKLSCISGCVALISKLCDLYETLPSFAPIAQLFIRHLKRLPLDNYPESMKDKLSAFLRKLETKLSQIEPFTSLHRQTKQKQDMKFLEPRIDTNFDPEVRRRGGGQKGKKAEQQRLVHKYKRELRGTVRELRRDNQFLAREKLKEQMGKDMERKRKTDDILKSLRGQESDFNKLKRIKDKL